MQGHQYRPDIDGLRALAVVPVVMFHAGVPGFSGGFTGVDIFFVISGYLLTGIILRELDRSEFSLARFYVRRARRILPALSVVVLFCALAGFFLLSPEQYAQFGQTVRAVATITANNHFASVQTDYWNQSLVAEQALLHTWSLAVEEQFYVILPLLLWAMHGRLISKGREIAASRIWFALGIIAAASLLHAEWLLRSDTGAAFYLLAPRAWELLAGSLLAGVERRIRQNAALPCQEVAGAAGLGLAVAAIVLLDEGMPFPGLTALVPCLGAVCIIYAGIPGPRAPAMVSRLLSCRLMVFIGLISYSLYLWHWPILVFARAMGWQAWGLPALPLALQLVIVFVLACLSWKWVEQPFRRAVGIRARDGSVLVVAAGVLCGGWAIGTMTVSIGGQGQPIAQVLPGVLVRLAADMKATPGAQCEGSGDAAVIRRDGGGCTVGAGASTLPVFAIVGDSHARMYVEAVHASAVERGVPVAVLARSSCVPALGLNIPSRPECVELTEASMDHLAGSGISRIVLIGYWTDIAPDARTRAALAAALETTVAKLVRAGKQVYLMRDVPELATDDFAAKAALVAQIAYGPSLSAHAAHQEGVARILESVASRHGATLLDPAALLCEAERGCVVARARRSLYRDRHHLTDGGAIYVRKVFDPVFASP